MRKGTIKAIVLPVVFILAVIIFSLMTNKTNEDLTTEMSDATLPVVTLYDGSTAINELYGYTEKMSASYMRDTITPIPEDRNIPAEIQTYRTAVDKISYEIRSLDGERLIADAQVDSYEENKGIISMNLKIQNLLEKEEEYLLVLSLEQGEDKIYYYTRIIESPDSYVSECLDFVQNFNDTTFNSEEAGTLSTYLERNNGDNTTLQHVTLNNSLNQLSWAEFHGTRLGTPVPSIKEITPTYNVIVLDYVITRVNTEGQTEYYNVEEYYRVRYTSTRVYLLNFERTMEEIFRGENNSFSGDRILLGIRSQDVEYQANESGNIVAFVQEGELWSYNREENTLAKVFSFRGYEGIDDRENYGEHDIKVVNIDETGSVDFIVYGYMNRGIHEGKVGIAVYHYDSLANTNEERVFIPSTQSYEVMKSELGQLMYLTESGVFYLMVDGDVYAIDLNTLETRVIVEGLTDEAFAISESNRYFVWVDSVYNSDTIHLIDFTTEKITDITETTSSYLKPLGFMKEDFVYGVAMAQDVVVDAAGNTLFPMQQVKIMDTASEQHDILKTYEKAGYYVQSISISDYTIYLNRIQNNGTAYVDADQDMIMNREGDSMKLTDIVTVNNDEKETQVQIVLKEDVKKKAPKILTPKEIILEEPREVSLEKESSIDRYYVYVKGDVVLTTDSISDAIITANEQMGVVIGDDSQYVWKRSRKTYQGALNVSVSEDDSASGSIAQCVNAMLQREGYSMNVGALIGQGQTPKQILIDTLNDTTVFDLTGCTVEEILYYVSNGSPVFAMTGSNDAVLVTGYDSNNVFLYDPSAKTTTKQLIKDADEVFSQAGNVFFTYLK